MWSNWPDEPAKHEWVTARVKDFQAANKQCTVKLSFIPKADIYTQAKSAVRTGQAPTSSTWSPTSRNSCAGGFLEPLDSYVDLANLEDWAKPLLDLEWQGLWPCRSRPIRSSCITTKTL